MGFFRMFENPNIARAEELAAKYKDLMAQKAALVGEAQYAGNARAVGMPSHTEGWTPEDSRREEAVDAQIAEVAAELKKLGYEVPESK